MRFSRLVLLAPLTLLAACGTAPQGAGLSAAAQPGMDMFGPDALRGSGPAVAGGSAVDPSRLKGLSPTQIRSVLGKPVFTRRDAPAEIWQYRSRACTLDLFLYDEGGSQTVAYYAVRGPQPINEGQCVGDLVGQGQRGQSVPAS